MAIVGVFRILIAFIRVIARFNKITKKPRKFIRTTTKKTTKFLWKATKKPRKFLWKKTKKVRLKMLKSFIRTFILRGDLAPLRLLVRK